MNKKIEELAKEAGMSFDEYGMAWADKDHATDGIDLERYTKLMIDEVILTIQMGIVRDGNTTPQYERSIKHIKAVRDRFEL